MKFLLLLLLLLLLSYIDDISDGKTTTETKRIERQQIERKNNKKRSDGTTSTHSVSESGADTSAGIIQCNTRRETLLACTWSDWTCDTDSTYRRQIIDDGKIPTGNKPNNGKRKKLTRKRGQGDNRRNETLPSRKGSTARFKKAAAMPDSIIR